MATISTIIELTDRVSASLYRIQNSLNATTGAFQAADRVSEQCFNDAQFSGMEQGLSSYGSRINQLQSQMQNVSRNVPNVSVPNISVPDVNVPNVSVPDVNANVNADFAGVTNSLNQLESRIQSIRAQLNTMHGNVQVTDNASGILDNIQRDIQNTNNQLNMSGTVTLNDRVTSSLNRIQSNLHSTENAFRTAERASERCFNPQQISAISQEITAYNQHIDRLERELQDANRQLVAMRNNTDSVSGAGSRLAGVFARVGGVIAGLGIVSWVKNNISEAIQGASDLTEVQNVVDVTFGNSAHVINDWSKTTLESFGLSELSAKKFASTIGAMMKSSGIATGELDKMSMKIAELSGDMASFYNLKAEDAFYKIRAGISGETEPLKELGINMSVANLEAYALSQGISESYEKMSQGEQTMLRYNYLLKAATDAQGDFSRTSGSFANQQKLLKENISNVTGEIGNALLPILTQAYSHLNTFVKWFGSSLMPTISRIGGWIKAKLTPPFEWIGDVLSNKLVPVISSAFGWIADHAGVIVPVIGGVAMALGAMAIAANWASICAGALAVKTAITGAVMTVWNGIVGVATMLQYGWNAAMMANPIGLIVAGILLLIGVVIACINWWIEWSGCVHSVIGVICGLVMMTAALIYNVMLGLCMALIQILWTVFAEPFIGVIEWVLNVANGGFNSFGDAVANLIGQIISWFLSLGQVVTKIIDAIFGTDWTGGLEALKGNVISWGKNNNAITLDHNFSGMDSARMDYGESFEIGANWGDGITAGIGDFFSLPEIPNPAEASKPNLPATDAASEMANDVGDIGKNTGNSAKGIDKLNKKVDISNENLEYMRDLAEQEVINRYTTAEIKIDMTNNNNISKDVDTDSFLNKITEGLRNHMAVAAEGVH